MTESRIQVLATVHCGKNLFDCRAHGKDVDMDKSMMNLNLAMPELKNKDNVIVRRTLPQAQTNG